MVNRLLYWDNTCLENIAWWQWVQITLKSSPWKAPSLPKSKKALLALLMLSETECLADRLEFHQTPRHFSLSEVDSIYISTDLDPRRIRMRSWLGERPLTRARWREYENTPPMLYSGTSHNGPSEKRTTSENRTSTKERIETTVELIH